MRLFCIGAYLLAFTIPLIGGTANAGLFNNRKNLDAFHLNGNKFEIADSNSEDGSLKESPEKELIQISEQSYHLKKGSVLS